MPTTSITTKADVGTILKDERDSQVASTKKGFKFWMIFLSICLPLFLSAVENSAVSTALPVIVSDLHGDDFLWVGAAYALASTAFLPMSGGVAEIFGRQPALLFSLLCFILGSALCGAARSMTWLIAARTIQGLGGGAILSVSSIIVSDLVQLKERGAYNGLIGLTWAIASGVGPVIGGALTTGGQWRWLFYLNLPICGVTIPMVLVFLKLPTPPGTWREKMARIDYIGNFLVISSTASIVIGLTWGGVVYAWSSVHVLVPLILGLCGLAGFLVYEAKWARNPIVPILLLQNRTSISGWLYQNFVNTMISMTLVYYVPVYFQSCKDASPLQSSVYTLGWAVSIGPVIIAAGLSVAVLKIYRPQLWFAWVVYIVAMGVYTTVQADTSLAPNIGMLAVMGVGGGILYAVTYFPVLSPLPVSENAHALAFFSFCHSFSAVWGISIGAAVLQNELSRRLPSEFVEQLGSGVDLAYAAIPVIPSLPEPLKDEVRQAFGESLAVIWKVMVAFLGVGLLASLAMRDVSLHDHKDEKWTLQENSSGDPSVDV
ncbi:Mfs1.2 [Cerioporus squamosus]|nr:Mfs1.2 [Cerioporus squamosus]